MDGQDQVQEVIATAARVKAGNASARDVAWLTAVRGGLVSSGNTALLGTIDDALAAQPSAAPATPADVPPTDWTVQPEIGGGPMPASFSEALATGAPATGATAAAGRPPVSTPTPPTIPRDFGIGALEGQYGRREPMPGLELPTPTLDFMQSSPGDLLKDFMTAGLNDPAQDPTSVYNEGTLPPTQKPKGSDPLAAYQTAPTNESPPLGTNMPGERPGGLFGVQGETDWSDERRALKNEGLTPDERKARRAMGATVGFPEDSAFAGISDLSPFFDPDAGPALMARMIAQKLTGGKASAMTAAMILPEVNNALNLVASGQIGRSGNAKTGLGTDLSDTDMLLAVEDFVTSMSGSQGTQIDPYASYQQGFKRALHTSEDQLQSRAASDNPNVPPTARLASQIQTTNEALMSGAGGMTGGAAKKLQARLDEAAYQWLEVAMRSAPGSYMTYPQFLKAQGAKTWFR